MTITEAKFDPPPPTDHQSSLLAFASIVVTGELGSFTVKDIKVIRGQNGGSPFFAMPFRYLTTRCKNCREKMPVNFQYCGQCAHRMPPRDMAETNGGKVDVFHPIDSSTRKAFTSSLLTLYEKWMESR